MDEHITLTFVVEHEDDQYVATCKELDISNFGDTVEEAADRLENAVQLYLDVLEEDGERERILRERGVEVSKRVPNSYRVVLPVGVFATVRTLSVRTPARA